MQGRAWENKSQANNGLSCTPRHGLLVASALSRRAVTKRNYYRRIMHAFVTSLILQNHSHYNTTILRHHDTTTPRHYDTTTLRIILVQAVLNKPVLAIHDLCI